MSLIQDRTQFVGGSEVAAVVGAHPFKSKWKLWMEKAGRLPPDDLSGKLAVQVGVTLEPFVADWWRRQEGIPEKDFRRVDSYWEHKEVKRYGASGDYAIYEDGGILVDRVVEIKTVGQRSADYWPEDAPPLHYLLQVQAQMDCALTDHGVLVALVGNNELRTFAIERDERVCAILRHEVAAFWKSVDAGEEPDPDWKQDADAISHMQAVSGAPRVAFGTATEEAGALMAEYVRLRTEKTALEGKIKDLGTQLRLAIGDAAGIENEGYRARISVTPAREVPPQPARTVKAVSRLTVNAKKAKS